MENASFQYENRNATIYLFDKYITQTSKYNKELRYKIKHLSITPLYFRLEHEKHQHVSIHSIKKQKNTDRIDRY